MKNYNVFCISICIFLLACEDKKVHNDDHKKPCDQMTAQWYDEQTKTKGGLETLRAREAVISARANYHDKIANMTTVTGSEKTAAINNAITCLNELKWIKESLKK